MNARRWLLSKKEIINGAKSRKSAELRTIRERLAELTDGKLEADERLAKTRPLLTAENPDRALVDMVVDKILVHSKTKVDIVKAGWFADGLGS